MLTSSEIIDRVFERTDAEGEPLVHLGIWPAIEAELASLLDAPTSLDAYLTDRRQADAVRRTAPNMLMSAFEAIAVLANIDDVISPVRARDADNYGTDVVRSFSRKYLARVNPLYTDSIVRLLWDAYRNGALHRFWPKTCEASDPGKKTANVGFDFEWRPTVLEELADIQIAALDPPHLGLKEMPFSGPEHSFFSFTFWPQFFFLELVQAVAEWERDVRAARVPASWISAGFAEFGRSLKLKSGARATVAAQVLSWRAVNAPAPPISE